MTTNDAGRPKAELLEEITELRRRVAALGQADARRRRAEAALEKERATLEKIIQLNPYSVSILDAGGHYVAGNQAFRDLFGGEPPPELSIFDDPILEEAGLGDLLARLKAGEAIRTPFDVWYNPHERRPDVPSKRVCTRGVAFPVLDDRGEVESIVLMHQDMTEQKQAEQAARASREKEQLFRERLATLHAFTLELSMVRSFDDLCRRAVELGRSRLGFERLGLWFLTGKPLIARGSFGTDEAGGVRDESADEGPVDPDSLMGRVLAGKVRLGVARDIELRSVGDAVVGRGTVVHAALWDGRKIIGCVCTDNLLTGRPISDNQCELLGLYALTLGHLCSRQRAAEALRQREELLTAIFESAAEGLLVVDDLGQVTQSNAQFAKMWRIPDDLMRTRDDKKLIEFVWGQLAAPEAFLSKVEQLCRSSEEESDTLEFKDGRVFERMSRPLVQDGRITGRVLSFWDVTERRRLEEQLRQAVKMEAIGQLAGGIAHDFNNVLTGILGYANLLKLKAKPGGDIHEAAKTIEGAAERAAELTGQLLGFARKGKYQIVPIDLHRTVHDVVALLGRTLDKTIRITLGLGAEVSTVLGDPSQLQQVFLNLAVNARDAMPEGGELMITSKVADIDEAYCRVHAGLSPGHYLRVTIADTGCGIARGTREHVFEPFFTTKPRGKGTGMGLAMAYGIVENHHGCIDFESEEGVGTSFRVYLPLADEAVVAVARTQPGMAVRGTGHILVVDDEEVVRRVASDMLSDLGYRVTVAPDGEEALQIYRERGDDVDLVIVDMVMPKMDGGACFRALREIDPDVRAVLSTGYGRDERTQSILDEGMLGSVPKPYLLRELSEAVADALGRRSPRVRWAREEPPPPHR